MFISVIVLGMSVIITFALFDHRLHFGPFIEYKYASGKDSTSKGKNKRHLTVFRVSNLNWFDIYTQVLGSDAKVETKFTIVICDCWFLFPNFLKLNNNNN